GSRSDVFSFWDFTAVISTEGVVGADGLSACVAASFCPQDVTPKHSSKSRAERAATLSSFMAFPSCISFGRRIPALRVVWIERGRVPPGPLLHEREDDRQHGQIRDRGGN